MSGFEMCPGAKFFTPTQADSGSDSAGPFRGVYVGVAGHFKFTDLYGNAVLLKNLAAGTVHPIEGTLVWSTGTTATDIVCISMNDHIR
jgi:hypothetical protein